MFCPNCMQEVDTTLNKVMEEYPVKNEPITIESDVRICNHCGEEIWDDELDEANLLRAFAEYRRLHNMLQPQEIRDIRLSYGLSQTSFAKVLGFGEKSITRYETGNIAEAVPNNLILLMKDAKNFKMLLKQNQSKIRPDEFKKAMAKVNQSLNSSAVVLAPKPVSMMYSKTPTTFFNVNLDYQCKGARNYA